MGIITNLLFVFFYRFEDASIRGLLPQLRFLELGVASLNSMRPPPFSGGGCFLKCAVESQALPGRSL